MRSAPAKVAIRRMSANDVEWAQRLAEGSPQAPHWPTSAYLAMANPESEPKRIALVAETPMIVPRLTRSEGHIAPRIGFAAASLVSSDAEIESIVVAPGVRRQGIGAVLMRAMYKELKLAGAMQVTLEVRESNRPALGLYRSLGFVESGRRRCYYVDPVEDAVLMRMEAG